MKRFILMILLTSEVYAGVKLGGFLDTYYAYDFNQPNERNFTTQPVRHNQPGINLAHLEAVLKSGRFRGRLAFQAGDSVIKNTELEPSSRGEDHFDVKNIQEAYLGFKLSEKTWIDGGVYLGHIGMESWISKDNPTYSRSLFLDYVPYYAAGFRLEHLVNENESLQFYLMNGWQNIGENNQAKAIGFQYKKKISEDSAFTYNNFLGDEEVVSPRPRFRVYHNFIYQFKISPEWRLWTGFDIGHQAQQENDGLNVWYATAITIQHLLTETDSMAFRIEYYNDRHQSNVVTLTRNGFEVIGSSINYDKQIYRNLLWRTELRGLFAVDEIYPTRTEKLNRWDSFLVSSLAVWF